MLVIMFLLHVIYSNGKVKVEIYVKIANVEAKNELTFCQVQPLQNETAY